MSVSLINGHIDDDVQMTDNEMIERLNKGEGFDYDDIIDLINRQKAEIERHREHIELLDIEHEAIKISAIKDFAERLKDEASEKVSIDEDFLYYDFDNNFKIFDSVADVIEFLSAIVVKEMVGEF